MRITHQDEDVSLLVRSTTLEAKDILSLRLERIDGGPLPQWRAGAHIDLMLPGVGTRQYSLSGSPADATCWRVSVMLEELGRGGSRAVHEKLHAGDVVRARGPRNNFALVDSARYLFVAGGIGITPIMPMIEMANSRGAIWELSYAGRSIETMAFVNELAQYGSAVDLYPREEARRLDLVPLLDTPAPDTLIYCCGPERMLKGVEELCQSWPEGSLHVERFAPGPHELQGNGAEMPFDVICARSSISVTVMPGTGILESLESAGLSPDFSCGDGICGTCETTVLAGVPDHRDSILSESEKEANGSMMICVGRSLSRRLVLDI